MTFSRGVVCFAIDQIDHHAFGCALPTRAAPAVAR